MSLPFSLPNHHFLGIYELAVLFTTPPKFFST